MRASEFTDEQMAMALGQHVAGTLVADMCRKLGVSDTTFFRWREKFGGLTLPAVGRRLGNTLDSTTARTLVVD